MAFSVKKFEFMDGLILTQDDKILKKIIHSIYNELDKEGFDQKDIIEFIFVKVQEHLASVE